MSRHWLPALLVPFAIFFATAGRAEDPAGPPADAAGPEGAPSAGANGASGAAPGDASAGSATGAAADPQTSYGGGVGSKSVDVNGALDAGTRPSGAGNVGRDGFSYGTTSSGATIRGGQGGSYVTSGQLVPELHTAKRGDTLWEISQRYFGNRYNWPRVWSFNRQIQNPHWIYPGDHIRLREAFVQKSVRTVGVGRLNPTVLPSTIFQRNLGFVLDGKTAAWGEIVGSPDDQMILSEQDEVYVQLVGDRDYQVGQKFIVFEPRQVDDGAEFPHVWIRGVVELDRVNPKTKMARARLLESMSEIHRGCKLAPYERNLDAITPVANKKTTQARIIGSVYPFEFYGKNQVVFIDKGVADGLEVGNRLFVVQRLDRWRRDARGAGTLGMLRSLVEDDRPALVEGPPDGPDVGSLPAETYGELIITRIRAHSATCLITASSYEIPRDATLLAREGY